MKKTFYFVATALLALVACTKETPVPEKTEQPVDAVEQELTTIYAFLDDTKSEVNTTTGAFTWVTDELISVAPTSGTAYNNTFKCTTPAEGAFTGTGDAGAIAISPKQDAGTYTSETDFQVSLPSSYSYVEGVTNALMVGTKVSETKYQFKHAAALLVVTYNNVPANTSALKVTSTTASQKLTGTVSLNGTGVSDIEIANGNTGLSGNEVNITFAKTGANVPSMTFYVPIPTGSYDAITFELVNDDSDLQASTLKTLKGATLNRADVYVIPAVQLVDGFAPSTVGAADNSAKWSDSIHSTAYPIEPGEILHIEFVNHSDKAQNYHNWDLFVANSDFGTDGYNEYFVLRADNYGWGPNYTANRLSSYYEWDSFRDDLDKATISLTVEYTTLGSILVKSKVVGTPYWENYTHPIAISDDKIYAFLWCEGSHFDIKKVWYSNSKKTSIKAIKSAYSFYVADDELNLNTIGWPKDVVAQYNDDEWAGILPSEITFPAEATLSATAGDQNYDVKYGGSNYTFTIPVIKGDGKFGQTTLVTTQWEWSEAGTFYASDLTDGHNVTTTMFVYSSCTGRWNAPVTRLNGESWDPTYINARMDNHYFGTVSCTKWNSWDGTDLALPNDPAEAPTFTPYQNHAKAVITISHASSVSSIEYVVTLWDGREYRQTYSNIPTSETITYHFWTEQSYVVCGSISKD